jgi:hypothetical protein
MRRLAESGVTVILKADHERFAESGDYWTLVFTGGRLAEFGVIRAEEPTVAECLRAALPRLAAMGPEWAWAADFVPGL